MKANKTISGSLFLLLLLTFYSDIALAQIVTITTTIGAGGTYSSNKDLTTGQQWIVDFTVLSGGDLEFYIFNSTNFAQYPTWPYEYYHNSNSTESSYMLTADADDTYTMVLHNSGGSTVTVVIHSQLYEPGGLINGYDLSIILGIITISLFLLNRKKRFKGK